MNNMTSNKIRELENTIILKDMELKMKDQQIEFLKNTIDVLLQNRLKEEMTETKNIKEEIDNIDTEKAIQQYKKHLQRLKEYNNTHKEQILQSARSSFQKLKADPEKYDLYKEKKRQYYHNKKKSST